MTAKIAVIIAPDFIPKCRETAKKLKIKVDLYPGMLEESVQIARQLTEKEYRLIISRWGTAEMIKKEFSIPIVSIDITFYDIFIAFMQARRWGNRIAFSTYHGLTFNLAILELSLQISVETIIFEQSQQLETEIIDAIEKGIQVFVGGQQTIELAQKYGLPGIVVDCSTESLEAAFLKAQEIIQFQERDQQETGRLKAILDCTYEGIIAVNKHEMITAANPAARGMLESGGDFGTHDLKNFPEIITFIHRSMVANEEILNYIFDLHDKKFIANCTPIRVNNEINGAVVTFQEVSRVQAQENVIRKELYTKGFLARYTFGNIVQDSATTKEIIVTAKKYALTGSTILITGESGTGKELFAQSIHQYSFYKNGPFVATNCSALPESLLESELFGYADGSFTGARKGGKPGLFELAHKGTIFLDEIGTISANTQARLLRVIQEKSVMRVGGDKFIPVDVRVIAATNFDLKKAVVSGTFRLDLFYRLNVLELVLPPIRERQKDIIPLAQHFLEFYNRKLYTKVNLDSQLITSLLNYSWPGNVRELENFIERYILLTSDNPSMSTMMIKQLATNESILTPKAEAETGDPPEKKQFGDGSVLRVKLDTLENMEYEIMQQVLDLYHGKKSQAAAQLGIGRTTLWKRLSTHV
ncbi:MAG: sigma 54-interacting transcriptional regulator [Desulfitobacteriaceae bacterium]